MLCGAIKRRKRRRRRMRMWGKNVALDSFVFALCFFICALCPRSRHSFDFNPSFFLQFQCSWTPCCSSAIGYRSTPAEKLCNFNSTLGKIFWFVLFAFPTSSSTFKSFYCFNNMCMHLQNDSLISLSFHYYYYYIKYPFSHPFFFFFFFTRSRIKKSKLKKFLSHAFFEHPC